MKNAIAFILTFYAMVIALPSRAQEQSLAKPDLLLSEMVQGVPKGDKQEVRVLTADLKPGQKTPFHTHPFPVTVYVLSGAFTLEMEGRPSVTLKGGQAMVEPPNVKMTGYNRSNAEPVRVLIFYVSDPNAPFLDVVK